MVEENWNVNPFAIVANGLGTSMDVLEQIFNEKKTLMPTLTGFRKPALVNAAFALPGSKPQGITAFKGERKDNIVNYINAVLVGYKQNGVCSVPNPNPLHGNAVIVPSPAVHHTPLPVAPARPPQLPIGALQTSPPRGPAAPPSQPTYSTPQPRSLVPAQPPQTYYPPVVAAPRIYIPPPQPRPVVQSQFPRPATSQASSSSHSSHPNLFSLQPTHPSPWPDPRINTEKKLKIYKDMCMIPGLSKKEIVEAIDSLPSDQLKEEIVLTVIISKREGPVPPEALYIKQQEDAMLDMAIRESETERENIQMRKRRRKDELRTSWVERISGSEEVQKSLFLFGALRGESSSGAVADYSDITMSHSLQGCGVVRSLVSLFDQSVPSAPSIASLAAEDVLRLRTTVVDLLLVEKEAVRFYGAEAHPLLLSVAHKIDKVLPRLARMGWEVRMGGNGGADGATGEGNGGVGDGGGLNLKDWVHRVKSAIASQHLQILMTISSQKAYVEKGLSKIPTGGSSVPDVFRFKSLAPFAKLLRGSVDTDGFEMVGTAGDGKGELDGFISDYEDIETFRLPVASLSACRS
eukprot:gene27995-33806_t